MAINQIEQGNRQRVIAYFQSGAKQPADMGSLGVEVEHFIVADDGTPVSYEPSTQAIGVRQVLEHLSAWYPERLYNSHRDLLGLLGKEGSVTLEPAAQLEISAAPYAQIDDVQRSYRHFRQHVDSFLEAHGTHIETGGYHPTRRAQELTLIPKQRYDFMDSYFNSIGSHGDRMMRASASTQVSVDFCSEEDAVRKMRISAALAPVLAAIADNTRAFEAKLNHTPIRRLQLWREVDNLRCGTVPNIFDEGFGFELYADWLLRTPPIFVTRPAAGDPQGTKLRAFFSEAAAEAYADAPLSDADVVHLISMFWPDVRLKRFVEIRPADCLPEAQVLGYAALIKGLFYSETSLATIEEELGVDASAAQTRGAWPFSTKAVQDAINNVQTLGMDADIYGVSLSTWINTLFSLASSALPDDERHYLAPLEEFAHDKPWWQTNGQNSSR